MICPKCNHPHMDVLKVFEGGKEAESRDLRCPICGYRATSITFLLPRPAVTRGKGGWAVAKLAKSGRLRPPSLED